MGKWGGVIILSFTIDLLSTAHLQPASLFALFNIALFNNDSLAIDSSAFKTGGIVLNLALISIVIIIIGLLTRLILTSKRLQGASLFNRLFMVVAITSAFFSAVSSAIGFGLITSQENVDFFRNTILPPAFGVFVFFVTLAIWIGGAELVRNRDWFRGMSGRTGLMGFYADFLFFIERCVKLFILIPILAVILFLVSTWTSVVGIAGVDAVRYSYNFEITRLQTECSSIVAFRQNDLLLLDDLRLAANDVRRTAKRELETGGQTGLRGRGAVTDYFNGVADWLGALEQGATQLVDSEQNQQNISPYTTSVCADFAASLKTKLSKNAFNNYDLWVREFETEYEKFRLNLNRWRLDQRLILLIESQLNNFERANPKPYNNGNTQTATIQNNVIDQYADEVRTALQKLIRKQKTKKPSIPLLSAAQLSPERGLAIFAALLNPEQTKEDPAKKRRTRAIVEQEFIPGLSTITPRDAVLKNFQLFSDVWALALSWDFASYILLLAYLFFPSAERAANYKD